MKYPLIIIFDDHSIKVAKSDSDINGSIEWSPVHYEEDDLIIDSELNFGRFSQNNEKDEFWAGLKGDNTICVLSLYSK